MTMEDLSAKFNGLSAELLNQKRQREMQEMIFSCEKLSARDFMVKLAV